MSKVQFWLTNLVGGVCAVLILVTLVFGRLNERTIRELDATQARINRAQQIQTTAQNLIVRIAQTAQTEPALNELLARHELKVELDNETPARPAP